MVPSVAVAVVEVLESQSAQMLVAGLQQKEEQRILQVLVRESWIVTPD